MSIWRTMRLVDLNPQFAGGEGISNADGTPAKERHGVGLMCDCPGCQGEDHRLYVPFHNPLDGGPPHDPSRGWHRTGDTFEMLTLTPSIARLEGCKWHGFITNGETVGA